MCRIYFFLKTPFEILYGQAKKNDIAQTAEIRPNALLFNSKIGKGCYTAPNSVLNTYSFVVLEVQIEGIEQVFGWLSSSFGRSDTRSTMASSHLDNTIWTGINSFVYTNVTENNIFSESRTRINKNRLDKAIYEELKESVYWTMNEKNARLKLAETGTKYFSN